MVLSFELALIVAALLLLVSVFASKISDRFGVPALVAFIAIGMLAGSDGPGGIYFADPTLAQHVGIVALAIILFSGGIDTHWSDVRSALRDSLGLATIGVLVTAAVVALVASLVLGLSWTDSFLLGAIVSSTDAAAVFSILRSQGFTIRKRVLSLIELESGVNDPMAAFLTVAIIEWITAKTRAPEQIALHFVEAVIFGLLVGYLTGKAALFFINRLRLGYDGLYPVLMLAVVLGSYGGAAAIGGSGFLAVYVTGLVMGREDFIHKRSLVRFYDGLAWLMQIAMFLTLGLLVFPSQMLGVLRPGLLMAVVLIFIARPLSVFISLAFTGGLPALAQKLRGAAGNPPPGSPPPENGGSGWIPFNEQAFIAWVGLRGAVPIVLATFPLIARLPMAALIFNVVFFVVLLSVLIQGTTIPLMARLTRVIDPPPTPQRQPPIRMVPTDQLAGDLREVTIPENSFAAGRAIYQLGLPDDFLVVLVERGGVYLIPNGALVLDAGDILLGLSNETSHQVAAEILTRSVSAEAQPGPLREP